MLCQEGVGRNVVLLAAIAIAIGIGQLGKLSLSAHDTYDELFSYNGLALHAKRDQWGC